MQYPIIDLITDAYLNNGWTGLYIKPINIWDEEWEMGQYNSSGNTVIKQISNNHIRSKNPIAVSPNKTYYMNSAGFNVHLIIADINNNVLFRTITLNNSVITTPNNSAYVYFNMAAAYGTTYNNNISINFPSNYYNYISQQNLIDNKNNIAHWLKLPLPHYFPHPVIDALQRASAGTQTADDTEILRHYLTPLGIGGI